MSFYPDSVPDPRKETLLAKSPFTKAVLDPMMWVADLKPHSEQIDNEMDKVLGHDWAEKSMAPLAIMATVSKVFNPEIPKGVFFGIVHSVVKVGWELGNQDDCSLILPDLITHLGETGALDINKLSDFKSQDIATNTLKGLLQTGIYFRTNFDKPTSSQQNKPRPRSPPGITMFH